MSLRTRMGGDVVVLLTTAQAAAMMPVSEKTLRNWVTLGKGPKVRRTGAKGSPVRYLESEVLGFVAAVAEGLTYDEATIRVRPQQKGGKRGR